MLGIDRRQDVVRCAVDHGDETRHLGDERPLGEGAEKWHAGECTRLESERGAATRRQRREFFAVSRDERLVGGHDGNAASKQTRDDCARRFDRPKRFKDDVVMAAEKRLWVVGQARGQHA